jgi:hypothetical protein
VQGVTKKGSAFDGNTSYLLQTITGGNFFIDNNTANVIMDGEFIDIEKENIVIDAQSGLLNTPRRENTYVLLDMLFEPKLFIYQKVKLRSSIDKNFNGDYAVVSISHRGTISQTVAGSAITSVGLKDGAFSGVKI